MKILLLGKNGQIGWELQRTLATLGEVIALGRQELDLTDQQAIRRTVRITKPDLIVNAAAYNAVDKAEEEPELAMVVNGTAPGILAEEAVLIKAELIHYSTDYVYDGTKREPYSEQDVPNPINIYGKTKLAGEEAIRQTGVDHLILRASWVYGLRGNNFLLTILRLATEKNKLNIVNDQCGAPTWCRMIAEATAQVLISDRAGQKLSGIYHLAAAGQTTWYGFAEAIFKLSSLTSSAEIRLEPVSSVEYKTAAVRPLNSVLDCSAFQTAFSIKPPHWFDLLALALQQE